MGHEVIEHTADLGLRVWAPDLETLFAEAGVALIGIMGRGRGSGSRTEQVELDAPDLEALLVDWLSEVLFLFEARGLVPENITVRVAEDPWRLRAEIDGGDAEGFEQHGAAVKAVTFHDIMVRRSADGVEARVYLDV